jgi:hypothetical protein
VVGDSLAEVDYYHAISLVLGIWPSHGLHHVQKSVIPTRWRDGVAVVVPRCGALLHWGTCMQPKLPEVDLRLVTRALDEWAQRESSRVSNDLRPVRFSASTFHDIGGNGDHCTAHLWGQSKTLSIGKRLGGFVHSKHEVVDNVERFSGGNLSTPRCPISLVAQDSRLMAPIDLRNVLPHMRGKAVVVDGNTYSIGPDGVARDVAEADAQQLLQRAGSPWRLCTKRRAGGLDITKPDLQLCEAIAAQDQFEAQKRGEANPPPSARQDGDGASNPEHQELPAAKDPPEVQQSTDAGSSLADDSGGEAPPPDPLPDGPDESMELEDLRQMADAYDVSYSPRTTKATLIKRLKEAME